MRLSLVWSSLLVVACGGSQPRPAEVESREGGASATAPSSAEVEALEPARVVNAMRNNELEIRKCFFRAPSSSGIVRIGWLVDKTGVVLNPAVRDSTIQNAEVERCLTSKVGELRFGELSQVGKAEWTYVYRLAEPMTEKQKKLAAKKRKRQRASDDLPGVVIDPSSPGSIDPDKIDEIVHAGYRLFARCYRDGFDRDTRLEGSIVLRFVIGESGRVTKILDGSSDLPDRRVIDCVAESFYALEFPRSPKGEVKVTYRLELE
jgi:hypothetical protein